MGIDLATTRDHAMENYPVNPDFPVGVEGLVLTIDTVNGVGLVRPSPGIVDTEFFFGISYSTNIDRRLVATRVETGFVPAAAPLTFTLLRQVFGGSAAMTVKANNVRLTPAAGVPGPGQFNLDVTGRILTFNAAQAGQALFVNYTYELTAREATIILPGGTEPHGLSAALDRNIIGVITKGQVGLRLYDTAVDWAAFIPGVDEMVGGPNGVISFRAGAASPPNGGAIPNASVVQAPTATRPTLTIRFNR